ncbi:uncharacterized protein LOC133918253 isoform X2 [Phragmites australis]|uniref:uncharacterized protein LOC133918253 isoform X2 n=1 Tax=Phragmites australis TaxID=29695 RepID=UPI002D766CE0|nr:uncharacterized protein LOC133918253 isoform X2 [Phragmites australis]
MVEMEKREKLVVGLTRRHMIRSVCSSSPPPADCNRNGSEGRGHKAALRQKKLKAKTLKWRSSNKDKNSKVEAGRYDGVYDDTVRSQTTASFSSLISLKRVRTLGKVPGHCDAVDPPVPRKLRSAINKRVGRFVSASSRHVKKRRHLSAISTQISFVDQETRFNESLLFTEEEEIIANALLSLSDISSLCELTSDKAIADSSNINVASTSYSEGATKEGDEIIILPSAGNELADQAACIDKLVERTGSVPYVNPVPGATNQHNNINPPSSENEQIQDLSLGVVTNLPSPSKDSSNNSVQKQLKVQFGDSQSYPAQKPEAPLWLVNSNKSDSVVHEREKAKNNCAQGAPEIAPLVQTPQPCTPDEYLIKPSSNKLAACTNTVSETCKVSGSGNHDKLSLVKNVSPTKVWKRSITHVYVSHVIQMHLNKEKAPQNQVKPEEISHTHTSRSPNSSTLHKNNAQDETFYAVHFNVRLPVQPSTGICDMSAGRQKMVSGNFLNLPTSTALPGAQHVQYLHPQIAPRGAMPYPFPHLPYSRGNLAPAAALQQIPQYVCNPGYAPRPSLPTSSSAMMKLQQLIPTQQQQQQMWQFHVPQYHPRPDAAPPAAAWHSMSSLRPMPMLPPPAMPPQMELFCAPYQGGSRQPQQLRLI